MAEQNTLPQVKSKSNTEENEEESQDEPSIVGAGFGDDSYTATDDVKQDGSDDSSEDKTVFDDAGESAVEDADDAGEPVREEIGDSECESDEGCASKLEEAISREQVDDEDIQEVVLSANKLKVLIDALRCCEQNISNVARMLEKSSSPDDFDEKLPALDVHVNREMELAGVKSVDGRIVEGVFDGQNMVGSDGKIYSVPPNYASKSKLVEGDMLKLTITSSGSFIYKQIGPIERVRVVAMLGFDPTVGEYYATSETKRWNVLKASVTYFKGGPDDEIVVLVPKNSPSKWAAVENIIKKVPNL